jgi:hypothetical protein
MRKIISIALTLMLTLTFAACSENVPEAMIESESEPVIEFEPEPEIVLTPVTDGNIVDFVVSRAGDIAVVFILELSQGLTLAESPQMSSPNVLAAYNPENGKIGIVGVLLSENDVVLRLNFNGAGTWILTEEDGLLEYTGSIRGEIGNIEPVHEPFGDVGAHAATRPLDDRTDDAK